DRELREDLGLGRGIDIAGAAEPRRRVVLAAGIEGQRDAGAIEIAVEDIDADTLAARDEEDVAIAHIEEKRRREAQRVGALIGGQNAAAAAQRDLPVGNRTAQRAQHDARRILPIE